MCTCASRAGTDRDESEARFLERLNQPALDVIDDIAGKGTGKALHCAGKLELVHPRFEAVLLVWEHRPVCPPGASQGSGRS